MQNFHPHLHFLLTEGGVDQAGLFHKVPRIDDSRLTELFAREVLAKWGIMPKMDYPFLLFREFWNISNLSLMPSLRDQRAISFMSAS